MLLAPEDSPAFHAELMRRCRLWRCVGFEVDFLDFLYLALPDAMRTAGVHEQYLAGLSAAAVAASVPTQLCMPLPSDVLSTVALPGVSNVRASDDNDLTYAPAYRWKIGLTSMLHGALGLRPWQTMWKVVLPQAVKIVVPPLTSNSINVMKDTALASVVAMPLVEITSGSLRGAPLLSTVRTMRVMMSPA